MITLKSKIVAASVVIAALAAPIAAQASPCVNPHSINSRWNNQQRRIDQGIRSGQLTPGETYRLEGRADAIRRQEMFDRQHDGGRLTGREHAQLEREENGASRSIYRDKHNDRFGY